MHLAIKREANETSSFYLLGSTWGRGLADKKVHRLSKHHMLTRHI